MNLFSLSASPKVRNNTEIGWKWQDFALGFRQFPNRSQWYWAHEYKWQSSSVIETTRSEIVRTLWIGMVSIQILNSATVNICLKMRRKIITKWYRKDSKLVWLIGYEEILTFRYNSRSRVHMNLMKIGIDRKFGIKMFVFMVSWW
jgi:hypothetical protein